MACTCRWQGLDLRRLRAHLLSINRNALSWSSRRELLPNEITRTVDALPKTTQRPERDGTAHRGGQSPAPPSKCSAHAIHLVLLASANVKTFFSSETELIYDAIPNTLSEKFSRDGPSLYPTALQRMPPRLSHRKSTTGCLRCKARKVKVRYHTLVTLSIGTHL